MPYLCHLPIPLGLNLLSPTRLLSHPVSSSFFLLAILFAIVFSLSSAAPAVEKRLFSLPRHSQDIHSPAIGTIRRIHLPIRPFAPSMPLSLLLIPPSLLTHPFFQSAWLQQNGPPTGLSPHQPTRLKSRSGSRRSRVSPSPTSLSTRKPMVATVSSAATTLTQSRMPAPTKTAGGPAEVA